MHRTALAALWAVLYAFPLFAQLPAGFAAGTPYRKSDSAPASCALHALWYDTSSTTWKECTSAGTPGTWTVVGAGSLGSISSKDALGSGAYGVTSDGGFANNEVAIWTTDGKQSGGGATISGGAATFPNGVTSGASDDTSYFTFLKGPTSDITTPATDKVSLFVDSADSLPSYKDEAAAVYKIMAMTGASAGLVKRSSAGVVSIGAAGTDYIAPGADRSPSLGCAFDGGGSAVTTSSKCYVRAPYACTITGWSIEAAGSSPTTTIDVWKVATGTSLPVDGNSITASAQPALATGNAVASTTLTGWTTSVSANDILGFNTDAVSNATWIAIRLKCQ